MKEQDQLLRVQNLPVGCLRADARSPHRASRPGGIRTRVPLLHHGKGVVVGGHGCFHGHQQYLPPETLRRKVTFTDRPF